MSRSNVDRTRCGNCGRNWDKCPARDVACYSCGKQGHFSAHCHSKQVLALSIPGFEEEEVALAGPVFLGTLGNEETGTWTADILKKSEIQDRHRNRSHNNLRNNVWVVGNCTTPKEICKSIVRTCCQTSIYSRRSTNGTEILGPSLLFTSIRDN